MSPDDFANAHPYDIVFPRSSVADLVAYVRHQTPILRSSFPHKWLSASSRDVPPLFPVHHAPVPPLYRVGIGLHAPTIVSIKICAANLHNIIKDLMEAHIHHCKGVSLGPIMEHLHMTIDDLPKLPGEQAICYNYILGRCVHTACRNRDGHLNASNIPDDFATTLVEKLCPAMAHF